MIPRLSRELAISVSKSVCCSVIGMAGGHFGLLTFGLLASVAGVAGSEAARETFKLGSEKLSEVAAHTELEFLGKANPDLEAIYCEALREVLREIGESLELGNGGRTLFSGHGTQTIFNGKDTRFHGWFENWDNALERGVPASLKNIQLAEESAAGLDEVLRETLAELNALGHMRDGSIAYPERPDDVPAELVRLLQMKVPAVLPLHFDKLLAKPEHFLARLQYDREQTQQVLKSVAVFRAAFDKEFGAVIAALSTQVAQVGSQVEEQGQLTREAMPDATVEGIRRFVASVEQDKRVPHQLPRIDNAFFGRGKELDKLIGRLRSGLSTDVVGPAGFGKTALAAEALRQVVGTREALAQSHFPDGVVYIDLYTYHGMAEPAWNDIANSLAGPQFMDKAPTRERAHAACLDRSMLLVIEGGEEADGRDGRVGVREFLSVLSVQNRVLLLTRNEKQSSPVRRVSVGAPLEPKHAADLFDSLTEGSVSPNDRDSVLEMLNGHPLAIAWAAGLLARGDRSPRLLVEEWKKEGLLQIGDPADEDHRTLRWLYGRTVARLDEGALRVLAAVAHFAYRGVAAFHVVVALGLEETENDRQVLEGLRTLVQHNLLMRWEEPVSGDAGSEELIERWRFTHLLGYNFARETVGACVEIRQRICIWISYWLKQWTKAEAKMFDPSGYQRAIEQYDALVRLDTAHLLWDEGLSTVFPTVSRMLYLRGYPSLAAALLTTLESWLSLVPDTEGNDNQRMGLEVELLIDRAKIDEIRGDIKGAEQKALAAEHIADLLMERAPDDMRLIESAAYCYGELGDIYSELKRPEAIQYIRRNLSIREIILANASGESDKWISQFTLSIVRERLANYFTDEGKIDEAFRELEAVKRLRHKVYKMSPDVSVAADYLSVTYNLIGALWLSQLQYQRAIRRFKVAVSLERNAIEHDPTNADYKFQLGVSLTWFGDACRRSGMGDLATVQFREAYELIAPLTLMDPTNVIWKKGHLDVCSRLGLEKTDASS